jgi:hypothetical protein
MAADARSGCRSTAWPCTYAAGMRARARQQPMRQRWRKRRRERRCTTTFSTGVPESYCCGHADARLPGARDLRGATSAPAAEGAARSCGGTASRELRLTPALGARAGWSAVNPQPESASFPAPSARGQSRSLGIGSQESSRAQP